MSATETSDELFDFEISQFMFLTAVGFRLSRDSHTATYSSDKLIYRITKQRYGDPPSVTLLDVVSKKELAPPSDGLIFYLPDYETEWSEARKRFEAYSTEKSAIAAFADLCKQNLWLFTSTGWAKASAFVEAQSKTEEWFMSSLEETGPMPNASDVICKLRSFRPPTLVVPKD